MRIFRSAKNIETLRDFTYFMPECTFFNLRHILPLGKFVGDRVAFAIPWADVWEKNIYFKGFSNVTDNATRSQWIIVKDSNTAEVAGFRDCDNYNIFTSSRLQENDGVYSITVDAGAIGWAEFNDSDRMQIQMVLNSGTAVSAADIANCIMTIDQPIMTAP